MEGVGVNSFIFLLFFVVAMVQQRYTRYRVAVSRKISCRRAPQRAVAGLVSISQTASSSPFPRKPPAIGHLDRSRFRPAPGKHGFGFPCKCIGQNLAGHPRRRYRRADIRGRRLLSNAVCSFAVLLYAIRCKAKDTAIAFVAACAGEGVT